MAETEGEFRYMVPWSARVTETETVRADSAEEAQDKVHKLISMLNPSVAYLDLEIGRPQLLSDWDIH